MHLGPELLVMLALAVLMAVPAGGVMPNGDEMKTVKEWMDEHFNPVGLPFSFVYGGKPSAELIRGWNLSSTQKKLDAHRTEITYSYVDPGTRVRVRCVIVKYRDYPTVEWTLHFRNNGAGDSPIFESIKPLDVEWTSDTGRFLLHHAIGSPCTQTDYRPLESVLAPESTKRISAAGGRPTNSDMSYFNLEMSGRGVIIAVGWPGQWASEWIRDGGKSLKVTAGQEVTHFSLHPGEEVRTPTIVLQFWQGEDWIRAQNIWRRWMIALNLPRPNGKLPPPQFTASSSRQYAEMINANEENQKMFIDRYLEEGIKPDYWWMDAGWYVNKTGWPNVGTWEVDKKRFPHGLRAVSDYAHSKGMKTITWFEPERVTAGTWLAETHPDWILGGTLLDLGNKEARTWLTNHIDKMITDEGIDLYRQDFNMDPLSFWRGHDTPDRQGITEIGHVTGLLAYWDELRKRHPDMLIDTCASGGRRNDLETLRRAVPLWRTDFAYDCIGTQCHTYGISFWIPHSGTGTVGCRNAPYLGEGKTPVEPYAFFSNAAPSLGSGIDMRVRDLDYPAFRRLVEWFTEYLAPNFYGDYYPLTPYSTDSSEWMAWQFDRPEIGEGVVEAFRRTDSSDGSRRLRLRGLESKCDYTLTDVLAGTTRSVKGHELLDDGLAVSISDKPGVSLISYRKVR